MSNHEREYNQRLSFGHRSNVLIILISINLILFIVQVFLKAIYTLRFENVQEASIYFDENVLPWFALPGDLSELGSRPWTLLTHMFIHGSVWHLLGNMLWLWFFGYILQDLTGNRKIIPVFLYGAFAGALAFLLASNVIPSMQLSHPIALGASAGVMGIAAAVTTLAPGYRIFPMINGGIPIWIMTVFYLIIDLAVIAQGSNTGGHIAHLAGALSGFLFIYFYRKGIDWGGWMSNFYDWFNDLFNPDRPKKGKGIREQLFYKSKGKPYHKTANLTEKRVNEILDKINQQGYQSLSEEEKDLLKKASKEDF